jgi:uncharacterized protein (TIGR00369 family)
MTASVEMHFATSTGPSLLIDHTAGGAARAAVAPWTDVITIDLKINFLKPAKADTLAATGQVLRAGKTIIASESEVYASCLDTSATRRGCPKTSPRAVERG